MVFSIISSSRFRHLPHTLLSFHVVFLEQYDDQVELFLGGSSPLIHIYDMSICFCLCLVLRSGLLGDALFVFLLYQAWTQAPSMPSALVSMLLRLPKIKFVIVTLGEDGCLMLERSINGECTFCPFMHNAIKLLL